MSLLAIWVDGNQAKLFQFIGEKMEHKTLETLQSHHSDHHTHPSDKSDKNQQDRKFYNEIANHLKTAAQILILGPGVAKHHFQTHLTEHFPALAKQIVGCETVDHPTDNQIVSLAKSFFKTATPLSLHTPN